MIMGGNTFSGQYNPDPYALPATAILQRAFSHGIRAIDTSPYYGPSESILGQSLIAPQIAKEYFRDSYMLLTKVGRISGDAFDYSPEWVRKSVARSLERLNTTYLDVVYCHDVEFVSPEETLAAVTELRRLRDVEKTIKYIGISAYPIETLCSRSEFILQKTGEPLDIVQSYAHFNLQNTLLSRVALPRLQAAGVDVVTNASMLSMGLLRSSGIPIGTQGDFHPSPEGLRKAIASASHLLDGMGEKIEKVALRYAIQSWSEKGAKVGVKSPYKDNSSRAYGVTVMGVSNVQELDETIEAWEDVVKLRGVDHTNGDVTDNASQELRDRAQKVEEIAAVIASHLGEWYDYAWSSPPPGFVNTIPARTETTS